MNIIKFTETFFINGKKHRKEKGRRETKQEKAMYLSLHDNIVHFLSFLLKVYVFLLCIYMGVATSK